MRSRILLLVVGVSVLIVLAFAIPLTLLISSQITLNGERAIRTQAQSVALLLRGGPTTAQITTYLASLPQTANHSTSVQLPDGTLLGRGAPARARNPVGGNTQATREPTAGGSSQAPGPGDPSGQNGNQTDQNAPQAQVVKVAGGEIAALLVPSQSGLYAVTVYVSNGALRSGENRYWMLLAGGSIGLLLIGLIGGEVITRRIVRPLVRTAQTAHRISIGDVTARAPTSGPREVADVGSALNRLADRIDELIAEERETAADLSHRLRTPLTSLRLGTEALRDPSEAERVGSLVGDVERMLTAIIRAARRPQREGRLPSCDATEVVGDRVLFWSALADDQDRTWEVSLPSAPVIVRASADDVGAAVDALLENVIAHTSEGTAFTVALKAVGSGAELIVTDDGPGLPPDAALRGRSDRGSSGLGLDIARRCAETTGGAMTIDRAASGGASITLLLRAP